MSDIWLLHLNPFLWEGVVFIFAGFLAGLAVSAIWGFPKRLLENI